MHTIVQHQRQCQRVLQIIVMHQHQQDLSFELKRQCLKKLFDLQIDLHVPAHQMTAKLHHDRWRKEGQQIATSVLMNLTAAQEEIEFSEMKGNYYGIK